VSYAVADCSEQPEFEKKEERAQVVEDTGRRYDPGAIFSLDLNSDESDSD
jgi:mediator of RNA polymerase II transcription subunit 4